MNHLNKKSFTTLFTMASRRIKYLHINQGKETCILKFTKYCWRKLRHKIKCLWIKRSNYRVDVLCLLAQSCPTLCDFMFYSQPDSSFHGDSLSKNNGMGCHPLFQGIFSTQVSHMASGFFTVWTTKEAHKYWSG